MSLCRDASLQELFLVGLALLIAGCFFFEARRAYEASCVPAVKSRGHSV